MRIAIARGQEIAQEAGSILGDAALWTAAGVVGAVLVAVLRPGETHREGASDAQLDACDAWALRQQMKREANPLRTD